MLFGAARPLLAPLLLILLALAPARRGFVIRSRSPLAAARPPVALPTLLDAVGALPAFARRRHAFPAPGDAGRHRGPSRLAATPCSSPRSHATADALLRRRRRGVPQAERWLADLQTLIDETPVALYPPREGFGEAEPHVGGRRRARRDARAGDARRASGCCSRRRARCSSGRGCRARCARPAPRAAQGRRAVGSSELAEHLERDRLRARADGRGRRAVQRARRHLRHLLVRHGRSGAPGVLGRRDRRSAPLRARDRSARRAPWTSRSCCRWTARAARSVERHRARVDRRRCFRRTRSSSFRATRTSSRSCSARGTRRSTTSSSRAAAARTSPTRDELFEAPRRVTRSARGASGRCAARRARRRRRADVVFPLRPPEAIDRDIKRLRRIVRDGMPTIILCDNEGQCERLDELLNEDDDAAPSPAALVDRRARWRIRDPAARRESAIAPACASSPTTRSSAASAASAARGGTHRRGARGDHRAQARRLRRAPRARRRHLSRHRDDLRRREHDRGRGHRVRGRRSAQRSALSHRPDRALPLAPTTSPSDAPPPRLHKLGGKRWAQQRDRTRAAIQEMTRRAARPLRAAQGRVASAARARHAVAAAARVVVPLRGHARPAQGDDAR